MARKLICGKRPNGSKGFPDTIGRQTIQYQINDATISKLNEWTLTASINKWNRSGRGLRHEYRYIGITKVTRSYRPSPSLGLTCAHPFLFWLINFRPIYQLKNRVVLTLIDRQDHIKSGDNSARYTSRHRYQQKACFRFSKD